IGERVPTDLEIEEDRAAEEAEAEADAEAEALKAEKDALKEAREKYLASLSGEPIEEPEEVPEEPEEEEEEEDEDEDEDEEYVYTKYTIDDGSLVRVTYEDGTAFILNYNSFEVTVEGYTIPAIGYLKIVD
ncbi:MAG: DUF5696 domain-containing protein, partial [Eubacteriales bacterium]|nr:DUF5696 domain-containing protein [Eubacteriales bacterium]